MQIKMLSLVCLTTIRTMFYKEENTNHCIKEAVILGFPLCITYGIYGFTEFSLMDN